MLGAVAAGSGIAGARGRRGRPRGVELALSSWRRAWAWTCVWQPVGAVVRRLVWAAVWRRSSVTAGLQARALVGALALAAAGLLAVGTGLGARLAGFPRRLEGGVLDEVVVAVADGVAVVVEVVESEAEERAVGDK